ncbi:zinc-finger domain-containing protein [Parvularcula sp. IMCC14364]|uniref:zinc-finger domain-containing protein n=1 Tax=Parvularcula sp. IMCC14364 TaxID=3067902 RepID=UPI002741B62E|nr:zinc-finger domain-containing protein [Parvularcula sp. IMCC14364]
MADLTVDVEQILARLGDVPEVTFVADARVACSGSGGALGHPKVYYTIGDEGYAECGYCDRVFIYAPDRA